MTASSHSHPVSSPLPSLPFRLLRSHNPHPLAPHASKTTAPATTANAPTAHPTLLAPLAGAEVAAAATLDAADVTEDAAEAAEEERTTVLVTWLVMTLLLAAEETFPVAVTREVTFPPEEARGEAEEVEEEVRRVVVGVAVVTVTPEMEARAVPFERSRVMHWLTKPVGARSQLRSRGWEERGRETHCCSTKEAGSQRCYPRP